MRNVLIGIGTVVVLVCLVLVALLLLRPGPGTAPKDPFPLHTAAVHFPDRVAALIQAGADVNCPNENGRTPLQLAVTFQKEESVRQLLAAGADANAGAQNNEAPLADAARSGNTEMAGLLLEHKADPNGKAQGRTALHNAAIYGHMDIARLLMVHGDIDLNTREDGTGYTALHCAVQHEHLDIISMLLEHGTSGDIRDGAGNTAFDLAKHKTNKGIEGLLLGKAQETR